MIELIGHFHPLLVHLPVGILLIALLLQWMASRPKYAGIKPAISIILLTGVISAFISCITGYFLSISDDYDQGLVNWHMWFAISVLIASAILYIKEVNPKVAISKKWFSGGLFILIMVTGHLGGSLTHGADYITKPLTNLFSNDSLVSKTIKHLPNVQEAMVYNNVIQPILEIRCYSCHNANKQKGGLRMDDSLLLMKGGEDGAIIDLRNPENSELIKRLLLPVDNDGHMPPKEKPQPTESQIVLLQWWISHYANFTKKVKELPQPDNIKPILFALQKPVETINVASIIPGKPVEKADATTLAALLTNGIMVLPVSQSSNYLTVNIANKSTINNKDVELLKKIKNQLIWLKIDHSKIEDDAAGLFSSFSNITRLNLSGTSISKKGWQSLKQMSGLEYLNLAGTNATLQDVLTLQSIKTLQTLYLFNTNITGNDYSLLSKAFPKTTIDTGNYKVPLLVSDTSIIKYQKKE